MIFEERKIATAVMHFLGWALVLKKKVVVDDTLDIYKKCTVTRWHVRGGNSDPVVFL